MLYDTSPCVSRSTSIASRMRSPDGGQRDSSLASVRCSSWLRGMMSSSYGVPLQYGQTQTTSSLANSDPLALAQLGLDGGAQDAAAFEPAERPLLFEQLAGHERQPEQLAVGWAIDAPASRPWLMIACV